MMHCYPQFDEVMADFVNPVGFGSYPAAEWSNYDAGNWNDYLRLQSYAGVHPFASFAPPLGKQEPMRLTLDEDLGVSPPPERKRPHKLALNETAPEFVPPPPGLGISDGFGYAPAKVDDMQPLRVDMKDIMSDLSFPLGLPLPPPGLEDFAGATTCAVAQADSTPSSLSTTASSLGEDRSFSSGDELEFAFPKVPGPIAAGAASGTPPTPHREPVPALRTDISRELRIERNTKDKIEVQWPVDARKLLGKDRQIISSGFELFDDVVCKLMIKPKPKGLSKGLASFQKAKGCGYIELKIVEGVEKAPAFRFLLSIGSDDQKDGPRGPVEHTFSSSSVCGLPKDEEDWDFRAATDVANNIFMVTLEVLS